MPAFGELPPTGYFYIEVPFSVVGQQTPTFGILASTEPYDSIEDFVKCQGMMNVERQDYLDRSRVYRFPNVLLKHFKHCGEYYLEIGCTRFPVLFVDPGIGKKAVREYTPLG